MAEGLTALNNRVAERGMDLHLESKLEQWRRQMMTEIQLLQHQLQLQKNRDQHVTSIHNNDAASLLKEIREV